jgi:hypothetical protein
MCMARLGRFDAQVLQPASIQVLNASVDNRAFIRFTRCR